MFGAFELLVAALLSQLGPLELGFEQALRRADAHPELAALRVGAEVRAPIDNSISTLTHNPELKVGPGWRFSSAGNDGVDLQVSLELPFVLSGLGGARRASAEAEASILRAEYAALLLERRLLVARSWFELEERQLQLAHFVSAESITKRTQEIVARAVSSGLLTQVDLNEARAHADEVALAKLDAEGHLFECSLHLAAAIAEAPDRELRASGALPSFELPEDRKDWIERSSRLPGTTLLLEAAELSKRVAAEEEASSQADRFSVGAQLQRESPTDAIGFLTFGWSPTWADDGARRRAQRAVEVVRAEEAAERAVRENARFMVELFHEVDHTREIVDHLSQVLVPSLRATHEGRTKQLALGETSLLAVLDAERRLLEGERRLGEAQIAAAWARGRAYLVLYSVGVLAGWETTP